MLDREATQAFEDFRPRLLGLSYRILGTLADAEDAVQDTFMKWAATDHDAVENPASWLTAVCTRRCLDLLRSAHRSRVDYVGTWLPEPIQVSIADDLESKMELSASLTTAFLLMLERLTPKERAAYLLREIFELPYPEIADTLDIRESTCRKLVSRAKVNIDQTKIRHRTAPERQDELLSAFQTAVADGATARLAELLADDIRLSADGGGKVPAILEVLHGKQEVIDFVFERLRGYWSDFQWLVADINGTRGFILKQDGAAEAVAAFAYNESGKVTDIYIVRNPDKLTNLDTIAIH